MAKRYYFTTDTYVDGENPCFDHIGNIRGSRALAKKVANEIKEVVYINDCETEDMVDCVFPD